MKRILKWNGRLLLRDWKTRLILIGLFLFLGSFSLLYRQQNIVLPEIQLRSEYSDAHNIFKLIPDAHFEGELGEEVERRLGRNSTLIGLNRYILSQREGNTVEGVEDVVSNYLENGRQMAENNLFLLEATAFESHDILTSVYLPTKAEIEQELAFYAALAENDLAIEWNPYASSEILKAELELFISIVLFIFIALLAGDHFTKDQVNHYSVTQGLPVPLKTEWRTRSFILWLMTWVSALLGFGVSYVLSLFFETTGSLSYPVALYIDQTITYIPLWEYGLLLFGLGMLVSYILLLIITGLSWMIQNIYLTLFIAAVLFFLPQLWMVFDPITSWQPSFYTEVISVVKGESARLFNLPGITFWKLPIVSLGVWLFLEAVFHIIFKLIPTRRSGLKRRVTQ
ncbi:hypothetical protein [Alkalibacterium kapii]|uniref:ABC transporter permease n=1 Tax=Alkalibacterium kapii TaxID=426704 RepID=A0A511AVG2_9LACT|nr:hypothetical protein [Alkalibacterium kapii]GEK91101.1 hypothetical protein AKA01nite_07230 [Alkalibacterium kapii]